MCIISSRGGEKKSIKGNIPIGFSLCLRPISASPMHRSCAQRRANDLLTSTRGQRIDGHSCCVGGLPGAQITDGMRGKKEKGMEDWTGRDDGDAGRNKHSCRFRFNWKLRLVLAVFGGLRFTWVHCFGELVCSRFSIVLFSNISSTISMCQHVSHQPPTEATRDAPKVVIRPLVPAVALTFCLRPPNCLATRLQEPNIAKWQETDLATRGATRLDR